MWCKLTDINVINNIYDDIKKNNGISVTNYNRFGNDIEKYLNNTEVFYLLDNGNLYIIVKLERINRLYYCISDENSFSVNFEGRLLCEIIDVKDKNRQEKALSKLKELGFAQYATYYQWVCDEYLNSFHTNTEGILFTDKPDMKFLEKIYDIFDLISDMLPLKTSFYSNRGGMDCIVAKDIYGKSVAAVLYDIVGKRVTEDYIYVSEEERGNGYGYSVGNRLIEKFVNDQKCRVYAWIEENNVNSIKMHQKLGYRITSKYKISMVR